MGVREYVVRVNYAASEHCISCVDQAHLSVLTFMVRGTTGVLGCGACRLGACVSMLAGAPYSTVWLAGTIPCWLCVYCVIVYLISSLLLCAAVRKVLAASAGGVAGAKNAHDVLHGGYVREDHQFSCWPVLSAYGCALGPPVIFFVTVEHSALVTSDESAATCPASAAGVRSGEGPAAGFLDSAVALLSWGVLWGLVSGQVCNCRFVRLSCGLCGCASGKRREAETERSSCERYGCHASAEACVSAAGRRVGSAWRGVALLLCLRMC